MTSRFILSTETTSSTISMGVLPYEITGRVTPRSTSFEKWTFNIYNDECDIVFCGEGYRSLTIYKGHIAQMVSISLPLSGAQAPNQDGFIPGADVIHAAIALGVDVAQQTNSSSPGVLVRIHCRHHNRLERWVQQLQGMMPQYKITYRNIPLNEIEKTGCIHISPSTND